MAKRKKREPFDAKDESVYHHLLVVGDPAPGMSDFVEQRSNAQFANEIGELTIDELDKIPEETKIALLNVVMGLPPCQDENNKKPKQPKSRM